MPKFSVYIDEAVTYKVVVEAVNELEAYNKAIGLVVAGKDGCPVTDREFLDTYTVFKEDDKSAEF